MNGSGPRKFLDPFQPAFTQLVAQVVERVKTFDFGAKDVAPVTILYPIDFLPAT